jgi:trehalose/maltose hydrolase-like predicted phosphorylase
MDILPIQASAVPCERIFSSAGETTTKRRNNINPKLMEALQMLKFALKKGHSIDFTKGTSKAAEISELEAAANEEVSVPEDILAFITSLESSTDLE